MADELIVDIEEHLRLNATGELCNRLTLDYIKMSLRKYKEGKELSVQEKVKSHSAIATFYAGTNPND